MRNCNLRLTNAGWYPKALSSRILDWKYPVSTLVLRMTPFLPAMTNTIQVLSFGGLFIGPKFSINIGLKFVMSTGAPFSSLHKIMSETVDRQLIYVDNLVLPKSIENL